MNNISVFFFKEPLMVDRNDEIRPSFGEFGMESNRRAGDTGGKLPVQRNDFLG